MSIVNPRLTFAAHENFQASRNNTLQGNPSQNPQPLTASKEVPLSTLKAYFAPAFSGFFSKGLNKQETIDQVVKAIQGGQAEGLMMDKKHREASAEYDNDDYEIKFTKDGINYLVESVNILEPSLGATAAPISTTKYAITVDDPKTTKIEQYVEINATEFQRIFDLAESAIRNM